MTTDGAILARRLASELPGAQVHGLAARVTDADIVFDDVGGHLAGLFAAGTAIIGVCASGILIRSLTPSLADKRDEPPVVAVAADGSVAVPLLGGHNGANALSRHIAAVLGGTAAITTASDLANGWALDDPPPGWTVANPAMMKPIAAAWLAGEPVALRQDAGDSTWLFDGGVTFADTGALAIHISDSAEPPQKDELLLHPPSLALGVGCERDVAPEALISLVDQTLEQAGLAPESVAVVTSLDVKMDEPAVHAVAAHLGVPVRFFDAPTLEAETPRLATPSDLVFRAVGCHGVAEGAALAAAGSDAALVVPKIRGRQVTCAIARAPAIDATSVGIQRGRLSIVGTGPGAADYRVPAADQAISRADHIVGYGPYIDLLGSTAAGKQRHEFALGEEEVRCRAALDLAEAGGQVVLVSSGDPGIYAMAALVFELLDRDDNMAWNRVALDVVPGVSAMQLAAARAGAPLGHDFCAISLSDLLTPWPAIEQRLRAAAEADFVVALYNPVSKKRRHQMATACEILQAHRPADTPVIIARNLARDGESVRVLPLAELAVDDVDMLSVVIIGNSNSRAVRRGEGEWVYTPRGYDTASENDTAVGQR
ncbi:MAG: precorrin-3B C(17)-methyltransferase [Alphaproteobacteria bacterium]|nr:precorrin-3B C(17)-methyltransferase [Alphaproteobacteria bacterium]